MGFVSPAPTPCRHWVSGSISLPSRGSFHLSITVLVRYRSINIFSLGRWSCRIQTGFLVPRPTWKKIYNASNRFAYRAFTFFGVSFQKLPLRFGRIVSLSAQLTLSVYMSGCPRMNGPTYKLSNFATPFITQAVKPLGYVKVWAVPISLATTFGIIGYSLFLTLLRWFSSAGSRQLPYVFR